MPEWDVINTDRTKHHSYIDVAHDLMDLPWPWEDEEFDLVIAKAVLEHLWMPLLVSMNECWRVLKVGGVLQVKLPYWRHKVSYSDCTHFVPFDPDVMLQFDPRQKRWADYAFYGIKPWHIIKGPWLNRSGSSFHTHLEKIND